MSISLTSKVRPSWWRRLRFWGSAAVVPVVRTLPAKFVIIEFQPGTGVLTRLREYDTMQTFEYFECPPECQMDRELEYSIYIKELLKHIEKLKWYSSFLNDVNETLRWKDKRDIVVSIVVGDTIVVYDLFRRASRATPKQFSALVQMISNIIPEAKALPIYGDCNNFI